MLSLSDADNILPFPPSNITGSYEFAQFDEAFKSFY